MKLIFSPRRKRREQYLRFVCRAFIAAIALSAFATLAAYSQGWRIVYVPNYDHITQLVLLEHESRTKN